MLKERVVFVKTKHSWYKNGFLIGLLIFGIGIVVNNIVIQRDSMGYHAKVTLLLYNYEGK